VDGLHVEGVAQNELDAFFSAKIGQPIPGEDALDGDDEVFPKGLDGREKVPWAASHVLVKKNLPVSVENAEVHRLGMQIDATVVGMARCVESHGSSLGTVGLLSTNQPTPSGVGPGGGLKEDQGVEPDVE
jgi:hypothetical protein